MIYNFSKQAVFDNKKAIRGGIPLIFRKLAFYFLSIYKYLCFHQTHMITIIAPISEHNNLSQYMRFPTMWYVRPAKPQISLHIRAI